MKLHEKMKALAEKGKLTAKEREFVVKYAVENGIQLNTLCKDCYRDAAIQLYSIYKPKEEAKENGSAYQLRDGLDVLFNGLRINEATLTDKLAKRILKQGFPERFFKHLPQ